MFIGLILCYSSCLKTEWKKFNIERIREGSFPRLTVSDVMTLTKQGDFCLVLTRCRLRLCYELRIIIYKVQK
jgi:hypothetical protein